MSEAIKEELSIGAENRGRLARAVKAFCEVHHELKQQMEACETAHLVLAGGWNIRLVEYEEQDGETPKCRRAAYLCRH